MLFAAACEIAPIIANAPNLRPHFAQFGTHLGIAFQLIDDALDYCANVEDLGKNIGDDLREGKMTLPVIIAYELGDTTEKAFWQRAIENGEANEANLEQAIALIAKHNAIAQTMDYAREHLTQASTAIDAINGETNALSALQSTLAFCLSRKN